MVMTGSRGIHDQHIDLQSKSQKSLTRYFPELVAALAELKATKYLLDGEIVIPVDGHSSFDDLLMRIHPAASRVKKLSESTPCMFIVFDLLVDEKGSSLVSLPLEERRKRLEAFAKKFLDERSSVRLSPVTDDQRAARKWFYMGMGLDGIVAKRKGFPYQSGERTGMQKIKKRRTVDCVV
jgi:ATP-dependent DNA ligase